MIDHFEKLNIAVLGYGVVGKGVCEIIKKHDIDNTKRINIKKILIRDKKKSGYEDDIFTDKIDEIATDKNIDLVVECMGNVHPTYEYVMKMLESGKKVVTSNKKLLSTKYKSLVIEHKNDIKYEATVCGGVHVFHSIYDIKKVDKIIKFRGIVNGTTNYILSRMTEKILNDKNISDDIFENVLEEAKKLGFAETDPSSDIDGLDAIYKAVLLHNEIFDDCIETSDDYIKKLIEDNLLVGIRNITKDDIINADKEGKIVKLIAYGDKKKISVMPTKIDKTDLFSCISLNINCLTIESDNLGISSYVGAGAGRFPTAHAVILDVCDFLK